MLYWWRLNDCGLIDQVFTGSAFLPVPPDNNNNNKYKQLSDKIVDIGNYTYNYKQIIIHVTINK